MRDQRGGASRRTWLSGQWWMVLWLACLAFDAGAAARRIAPGDAPALAPGEGLLVVAVDTTVALDDVRLLHGDTPVGAALPGPVAAGHHFELVAAPAGRYRWASLRAQGRDRPLDAETFAFDLKPGIVNYPGDVVYRPGGQPVRLLNHGLPALDWLARTHPVLARDHAFAYAGAVPDPFPAAYRAAHAGAASPAGTGVPPTAGGPLPLAVDLLWKAPSLERVALNPGGDLLAFVERRDGAALTWTVELRDLRAGGRVEVLDTVDPVARLDWSGDRALVVSTGSGDAGHALTIVRLDDRPGGGRRIQRLRVPRPGRLVDALPEDPDHILFASAGARGGPGEQVVRLDIASQAALDQAAFDAGVALDHGVQNVSLWMSDARGRLRAAIAADAGARVLLHGEDGRLKPVLALADSEAFDPVALSADGDHVYGYASKGRNQRDLVEFDPATGRVGRTLFSEPGVDVQAPLFDARRNLIGASYYDGGRLVARYFDAGAIAIDDRLRARFPGRSLSVLDRDVEGRHAIVMVEGSDAPAALYHFDAASGRVDLLEETRPWLDGERFAPARVLHATSRDGLKVEAYLTLPAAPPGPRPVVVLAHGGPLGLRDTLRFDPEVQFLASLGYAVLQVNFRGSGGYGAAFENAGLRAYGTGIEDDIEAALDVALARYPLDGARVCTMGSSYGGYSAAMLAIRDPGRYRCVVSLSGMSDLGLFFSASDTGQTRAGRQALETAVGDPRVDDLQAVSPLYRLDGLTAPLLLVHGTEDPRVDFEHARRLARLLALAGRPPVLLPLAGEGHGIARADHRREAYEAIAGFLREHLDPPAPATRPD